MPDPTDPLWYKDAVIYQAHVRAFLDTTSDGVGDFAGLTQKLDYLQGLGIDTIWLLPFYPSPLRDDGYDIADYENVHPTYGTLDDFDRFMAAAHTRGLRVITELVINHTSDQHPWFQAARRAPAGSPERDFYVWSDTNKKYQGVRIIFTDTEQSNWSWDDTAKAYYWHRFFRHQPDLNFDNPAVLDAVLRVMRFWLDRGVDGLRLDAVPYLIEREGTICENLDETHEILRRIRRELDRAYPGRMLLAEANQWPADVRPYFGDGDECHMAFHFPLMPRMFMALQQEDRHPIVEILRQTPDIPDLCQWAMFLRNHDELTLEMVTDEERDYMYQAYASDPQMRINVGIRRRLAPLLGNSRRQIELINSLLFSMPGTPVIYYGDEIAMGDNIYLGDRNGVRTPMQWTGDRNAGFSRADPARLYAPPIMDPVYGYQAINVEAQERSPYSLLNWMRRMIGLRKQHKVFGRGTIEFLHPDNRKVLVYVRRYQDETVLCVANLSRTVQPVELDLSGFKGLVPVEMLGSIEFPRIGELPYFLTLAPRGFYWFRLQPAPVASAARVVAGTLPAAVEHPALLMGTSWESLLDGSVRTLIERDLLVPFLRRQRWFGGKARRMKGARFVDWILLRRGPQPLFLTLIETDYEDGGRGRYSLPLALGGAAEAGAIEARAPHAILARVTGARKGIMYDGWLDDGLAAALLDLLDRGDRARGRRGAVRAERTEQYGRLRGHDAAPRIRRTSVEQSNSSIIYGDALILKLFRKLEPGVNPDFEISRQLTERMRFERVPAVAGALHYERQGEPLTTIGMLQAFVESQGDGWAHATEELGRFYDRTEQREATETERPASFTALAAADPPPSIATMMAGYLDVAARLGRRTAEMHLALAVDRTDAAFVPEPLTRDDLSALAAAGVEHVRETVRGLQDLRGATGDTAPTLAPELHDQAERLIRAQDALVDRMSRIASITPGVARTRVHGDYHLGQVLIAEGDFYILDFEGEPARPLSERRRKQSPLKDVAGMLRSFSYAAWAALFVETSNRPQEFPRLERWARQWRQWAAGAFLREYFVATAGAPFIPADTGQRDELLRFYVFDKALYELRYELNNRPDWARIPLQGIVDLL